jgi:pyrophosphatase PpaX
MTARLDGGLHAADRDNAPSCRRLPGRTPISRQASSPRVASGPMRFETVLFDLDGTLIDSGGLILASFQYSTRTVLNRVIPDDLLMANVGGHGVQAQMEEFDVDRADELTRVYREHNKAIYRNVTAFPGIEPVLQRLSAEGRALGVVTVKGRPTVDVTFEVIPMRQYFGAVVTGDDTHRHKPDPEPLLLALAQLAVEPAGAVYVGDSPFDIQAAKAAEMTSVAVAWGGIHSPERLAAEQPDVMIERPKELLGVL